MINKKYVFLPLLIITVLIATVIAITDEPSPFPPKKSLPLAAASNESPVERASANPKNDRQIIYQSADNINRIYKYEIEIPGEGKYLVESPTELTDAQVYVAAKEQISNDLKGKSGLGSDSGEVFVAANSGAIKFDDSQAKKLGPAQLPQVLLALEKADAAGNVEDARQLARIARRLMYEERNYPATTSSNNSTASSHAGGFDSLMSSARTAIESVSGNSISGRFKTTQDCFDFIKARAGTSEKLRVGAMACQLAVQEGDEAAKRNSNLGACILNNYKDIQDDVSGTRVVSRCGESTANLLSTVIAKEFSPTSRLEKLLEENREKTKQNNEELKQDRDGPFTLMIDGRLKTCTRIGEMVNCI